MRTGYPCFQQALELVYLYKEETNVKEVVSNIKKHTCPTCAGQLIINQERQMYECPFCGVTFDYEYFREDDVLSRADRFLKSSQWDAAVDAFDFMLAKDPHNFIVLRGKILAVSHMHSLAEMANLQYQEKVNILHVMPFMLS